MRYSNKVAYYTKGTEGENMNAILWLIVAVALLVFESVTVSLMTIWFAAGALVAFIAAMLKATWWLQFILFIVVSFVMLIFTRPWALKHINSKVTKTNIDSIIGLEARVISEINNDKAEGYVVINGQEWAARSVTGEIIPVDTRIVVKAIQGVKVMVEVIKESNNEKTEI